MPNGQLRDKVSGADDLHHAARASLSCSKQVLVLVLVPLCVRYGRSGPGRSWQGWYPAITALQHLPNP